MKDTYIPAPEVDAEILFLHMGQGFPHQLPVLENVILQTYTPYVSALLLYKIAFILLSSGRKFTVKVVFKKLNM